MEKFLIVNKDGSIGEVPMMYLGLGGDTKTVYAVIGADFLGEKSLKIETGLRHAMSGCMGKYSEQDEEMAQALKKAFLAFHWDIELYPDPEIIRVVF